MLDKMRFISRLFLPKPHVQLGRWRLKHDNNYCDIYFKNYHGEPGYPNMMKTEWIKSLNNDNIVKTSHNNKIE